MLTLSQGISDSACTFQASTLATPARTSCSSAASERKSSMTTKGRPPDDAVVSIQSAKSTVLSLLGIGRRLILSTSNNSKKELLAMNVSGDALQPPSAGPKQEDEDLRPEPEAQEVNRFLPSFPR